MESRMGSLVSRRVGVAMEPLGLSPGGGGLNVDIVDDLNFLKHVMFKHFQNIAL